MDDQKPKRPRRLSVGWTSASRVAPCGSGRPSAYPHAASDGEWAANYDDEGWADRGRLSQNRTRRQTRSFLGRAVPAWAKNPFQASRMTFDLNCDLGEEE